MPEKSTDPKVKPAKPKEQTAQPEKEPPEKKAETPPGTGIRTKILMTVSKTLSPISIDYRNTEQLNYAGIEERPDFVTRFGQGTIAPPDSMTAVSRQNAISETGGYSARTKLNLPFDMGLSFAGKYDKTGRNSASSNTSTKDMTLPDLSFDWSRLENKLPYINRYCSNMSLRSAYSLSNRKDWQNNILTSEKTSKKFSPLASITFNIFKEVQASFSLSASTDEIYDIPTKSLTLTDTKSTSSSLRYRISSTKTPGFLNWFKLKSDINLSLNFSTQKTDKKTRIGEEKDLSPTFSTSSWTITPKVEYRFSQKFQGGMDMEFKNSKDMTNKVYKVRQVSIWGELRF